MKIIKNIFVFTLFLTMMWSCDITKETAVYGLDPLAIKIDAVIEYPYTRTNPIGESQLQFNNGDQIQISCEDGNMTFAMNDGKWSPTDYYYLRWGDEPLTYTAFSPVTSGTTSLNFTLPVNQKEMDNLVKSDYMTCTLENAVNDGTNVMHLSMRRRMAKVVMKLENVAEDSKVYGIKFGSYTGYTGGQPDKSTTLVTPYVTAPNVGKPGQDGTVYTAIVVPGKEDSDATFVTFNYNGEDILMRGIPAMREGQSYEFVLKAEGSVVSLSEPVVKPWTEGTLQGGDVTKVVFEAYFVKPQSCGNGTGIDWDNALGTDGFRKLISTKENASEINGKKIYLTGGEYEIIKNNAGVVVNFNTSDVPVKFVVEGGYDPASTGKETERRNVKDFVTTFVRNTKSTESKTNLAMFSIEKNVDITFDGIIFDGKHTISDKGKIRAFFIGQSTNTLIPKNETTLRLNNCAITDFNVDGATSQGPAIYMHQGSAAWLHNVDICNNVTNNRGVIHMNNGNTALFLNRCRIYENVNSTNVWGGIMHTGVNSIVCVNNSTFLAAKNSNAGKFLVNGDSYFLIANSSLVGGSTNSDGTLRSNTNSALLVNSLVGTGNATQSAFVAIFKDTTNPSHTSKGYNVYQKSTAGWGATTLDTDYSSISLPAANLEDGVYKWTLDASHTNFATKTAVEDAIKAYSPVNATMTIDGSKPTGQLFIDWCKACDGENAFGIDGRGVERNPEKMQPGAYDTVLQ